MAQDFAHAFGDALKQFLDEQRMGQNDAARELGLPGRGGARLNAYLHDRPDGTRPKPEAEILYLLCARLGFSFEYNGYKISAESLNGKARRPPPAPQQIAFTFDDQFNLSYEDGRIVARTKRPPDRAELFVSLKGSVA